MLMLIRIYSQEWLKLVNLGIDLIIFKRYVDDITILMNRVKPGWRFNGDMNCMEFKEEEVEADKLIPDDVRSMRILCEIANTISQLRFTMDCPSLNDNKMVPILDTQLWIEGNRVQYIFYKKSCSSQFTVLKRSAIPDRTKRQTIFQEGIRRCYTTSPTVGDEVRNKIMADYSNMLRLSGYSEKFRVDTVEGVLSRWEVILKEVHEKKRVLHRSTSQIIQHKLQRGTVNNSTWFLKGENTTTMSVPITPASKLRNNL